MAIDAIDNSFDDDTLRDSQKINSIVTITAMLAVLYVSRSAGIGMIVHPEY